MKTKNIEISAQPFAVNGRRYLPPAKPIAVICIDGCADEYLSVSLARERMPHLREILKTGHRSLVRAALPTFTNVNNSSIVTGCPPSETGIGGNFMIDPETGAEVMTNSPEYLQLDTILAAAECAGRKVAMVTAKDKLRKLLSKGMNGIAFSVEKAEQSNLSAFGIDNIVRQVGPTPPIYSAEASVYVLRAGVELIRSEKADFCYLTLTDFMQHTYPPEAEESLEFYNALDQQLGRLRELNCLIAMTADHGMNAKTTGDGQPNVVYLESELRQVYQEPIQVICPITDPYVVHHGALGSAVMVYLDDSLDKSEIAQQIFSMKGISEVYPRDVAASKLQLPYDRIGDLFVLAQRDYVIGKTPEYHDLGKLEGNLRSHGGRYEEMVPMILSFPLNPTYYRLSQGDPRNFDIFEFACNGSNF